MFGFLALLEGGLNHVVPHARRSEGSADLLNSEKINKKICMELVAFIGFKTIVGNGPSDPLSPHTRFVNEIL